MAIEHTQQQSSQEQSRSQSLSMKRLQPPTQVPGYEPRRFLGAGAFGEVWVAIDRTTGRQVAIKFFVHRGGVDWALLSREVEKLAFLSADRYVVQLLDVGWEAEPPYYVMEYIEQGSLEERLKRETKLPVREAVALFQEITVGILHAHAKGVLHCDLKPANVLLDQDGKPRLADFGQSRLSSEQTPALGTLFYMAPEQADLSAMPDVRWDVYALGALLYCMLTGNPPHKTESTVTEIETAAELETRLARYREILSKTPFPRGHRQTPGVDRELADIIDGCLATNLQDRFPNVQAVLDALDARERRRAQRSLAMLGAVGPALVLAMMSLFFWWSSDRLLTGSDQALRSSSLGECKFAAKTVAEKLTNQLDSNFQEVEVVARGPRFQRLMQAVLADPQLAALRKRLSDPKVSSTERAQLQPKFLAHPLRLSLQQRVEQELADDKNRDATWLVTDEQGLQLARASRANDTQTIGLNYAWRSYFHGKPDDQAETWRPDPEQHITKTTLSSVFRSLTDARWHAQTSTPIITEEPESRFLGVLARSIEIGPLVDMQDAEGSKQFAVLVDMNRGQSSGVILQHPLYNQLIHQHKGRLPDWVLEYRLARDQIPEKANLEESYVDPLGKSPEGEEFNKRWLAASAVVSIRDGNTGWIVIVQNAYDDAIGRTLEKFKDFLWSSGRWALLGVLLLTMLWVFVLRSLGAPRKAPVAPLPSPPAS